MSDNFARPYIDVEATSGASSHSHQASWMSHWMKRSSKPPSMVNNSSVNRYKDGHVDHKSCLAKNVLQEAGFPNSGKELIRDAEENASRMMNGNTSKRTEDFLNKISNSTSSGLKIGENSSAVWARNPDFGHNALSLALAIDKKGAAGEFGSRHGNNFGGSEKSVRSRLNPDQKAPTLSRSLTYKEPGSKPSIPHRRSTNVDPSEPVVVFEKHFSNDNFTCLGQGQCKYQKFSTFLFHEKQTNNDHRFDVRQSDGFHRPRDPSTGKNFLPFIAKKQSENAGGNSTNSSFPSCRTMAGIDQGKTFHGCQAAGRVPCSLRNVETMRICTMVDSVENSYGGTPKFSQRAHHVLYTKETCVNMSEGHQVLQEPKLPAHQEENAIDGSFSLSHHAGCSRQPGLKIQPLWTSTDSEEKENTNSRSIRKEDSRNNESAAETDTMQIEAPQNHKIQSGAKLSLVLNQDDAVDEHIPPAEIDSGTEKMRGKKRMAEIPDMNEDVNREIPALQPAVSSTDGTEPSTSRVRSLDAKNLFSGEQASRSVQQGRPLGPDESNRWIKRLKLSSSDSFGVSTKSSEVGESSSHEKFSMFFNRMLHCNRASLTTVAAKHHNKEKMALDQSLVSPGKPGASFTDSKKGDENTVRGSPWIQRWCQRSAAPPLRSSEPLVICEPHSLKLGQDDLGKKPFPSIAAMALMGKAMYGFRPCEFSKRGPVVVWNTMDY